MIRLLLLSVLAAGSLAAADARSQDTFLAEGLPNATLSVKDVKGIWLPTKKGDLFRLTTGKLIFLARGANSTEVIEKPDPLTTEVVVGDNKNEWRWTSATKKFEGSKPLAPMTIDITPAKATPADEAKYLYFSACRLWDRLDASLQLGDMAAVESIRKRAADLEKHANDRRFNPDVSVLFRDMQTDVTDFKKRIARRQELWKDFQEQAARLEAEARAKAAQAANEQMMGLMKLFVGGLTATNTDRYYDPSDDTVYSVTTVNEGSVRLAGEGMGDMMAAGIRQSRNQSYFNSLKSSLKTDIARRLEETDAEYAREWQARRTKTEAFARKNFGIEPVGGVPDGKSLVRLMIERKDRETLQKIIGEQVKGERGSSGRDNPFRLADLYECEVSTPSLNAESVTAKLAERSRGLVAAARLVPSDRAYDLDRAGLLLQAATMANLAAQIENSGRTLTGSVSTNALFAGHCVAKLESMNLLDTEGQIRKQKVSAFARSGRVPEAAEQIASLGGQLGNDAEYQFLAAQVYATVRKPEESAKALAAAMKAGFSNIPAIRSNPSLQSVLSSKSVKALLEVRLSGTLQVQSNNGFGPAPAAEPAKNVLKLTNDSEFPLTNVKIQAEVFYNGSNVAGSRKTLTVDRIGPGATVSLPGAAVPLATRTFGVPRAISKVTLSCDQLPAASPQRFNPTTEFK